MMKTFDGFLYNILLTFSITASECVSFVIVEQYTLPSTFFSTLMKAVYHGIFQTDVVITQTSQSKKNVTSSICVHRRRKKLNEKA